MPAILVLLAFIAFSFPEISYAEQTLADTIAKIKPGIVAVGTYMPKRNPRAVFLATGFAVGDGSLIVTNAHVIPDKLDNEHMEQVAVFYHKDNNDKAIIAKEVALDKEHDLAVLKITGELLSPLKLGSCIISTRRTALCLYRFSYRYGFRTLSRYPSGNSFCNHSECDTDAKIRTNQPKITQATARPLQCVSARCDRLSWKQWQSSL